MKHKYEVPDSSTIKSLEYDFDTEKLVIEFRSGSKYLYSEVPEVTARDLFLAESKGKYFAANIKDVFITEKIGVTLNPPVPWPKAVSAPSSMKPTTAKKVKAFKAPKAQPEGRYSWPFSFNKS